jgi:quercetin dioxygenase-like cupin family protein
MRSKIIVLALALALGGVFLAGVAVGKEARQAKFITREEVKWIDRQGLRMAVLSGDIEKGPYTALLQLKAGAEPPWHSHTGDYEAVEISGTTRHWMRGEDGTKAKKMAPGSYWTIPGGVDHVSVCDQGVDCLLVIWQRTRFDALPAKEPARAAAPAVTPGKLGPPIAAPARR